MQAQQIYCQQDGSVHDALVDPDSLVLMEDGQPEPIEGVEVYSGTITLALGGGSEQQVSCVIGNFPDGIRIHLDTATIGWLEAEQVYLQLMASFAAAPVVPVYATDTSVSREDLRVEWASAAMGTALEPMGSGWLVTAPLWMVDVASGEPLTDATEVELTVAWNDSDWLVWATPEVLAAFVAPEPAVSDDEIYQQAFDALRERPEDGVCRMDAPDVVREDVRVDWDSARDREAAGEWMWTVTAPLLVLEPDGSEHNVDPLPVTVWWDGGQGKWRAGLTEEDLTKLDYE